MQNLQELLIGLKRGMVQTLADSLEQELLEMCCHPAEQFEVVSRASFRSIV